MPEAIIKRTLGAAVLAGEEGMTPKVFLYSCWCSILAIEVAVTAQLVVRWLMPPDMVVMMNRSPEWRQSVELIISMITPDLIGSLLLGTMVFAWCLVTFGSLEAARSGSDV